MSSSQPPPTPAGDTIYNLSRFNELETGDGDDRPVHPPVLTRADVLWNPFDDLVPRVDRWVGSLLCCFYGDGDGGLCLAGSLLTAFTCLIKFLNALLCACMCACRNAREAAAVAAAEAASAEAKKPGRKQAKNFSLMSFGEQRK